MARALAPAPRLAQRRWRRCRRACSARVLASSRAGTPAGGDASYELGAAPTLYCASLVAAAAPGAELALSDEEARHARALRLRPGDAVRLVDLCGRVCGATLAEGGGGGGGRRGGRRGGAVVAVAAGACETLPWPHPSWDVCVACSTLSGGRADWLVEKSAELGAGQLTPLLTERSCSGSQDTRRRERWERVAHAASKQCLRAHALALAEPQELLGDAFLRRVRESPAALLATPGAPPLPRVLDELELGPALLDAPASPPEGAMPMLLVGPEGDFTDAEKAALIEAGARAVGLGRLRLRAETAAIAMLASCALAG